MQESDVLEELWAKLGDEARESEDATPPSVQGLSQNPTFADRLAQRLVGGVVPLFLMGLAGSIPFSLFGGSMGVVLTLICLLTLSWLAAPLVRANGYISTPRLILLSIPIVVYSIAGAVVSAQLTNPYSLEHTATLFQLCLEAALGYYGLTVLLPLLLILAVLIRITLKSRPWVRVAAAGRVRMVAGIAVLILPGCLYLAPWVTEAADASARAWKAQVEAEGASDRSRRSTAVDEVYTHFNFNALESDPEKALKNDRKLVEKIVAEKVRPKSKADGEALASVVRRLLGNESLEFTSRERTELAFLLIESRLLCRPRYQTLSTLEALRDQIFPELLATPDLSKWERRITQLQGCLPENTMQEFDLNAWDYFYAEVGAKPEVFGKGQGVPKHRRVYLNPYRQLRQVKATEPRPLKVFGAEVSGSPSQMAARWTNYQKLQRWLEIRERLVAATSREQLEIVRRLESEKSFPSDLQEELDGRTYSYFVTPWLESAQLILQLRTAKAESGSYPASLEKSRGARWLWEKADQGWTLRDTELAKRGLSDAPTWVLP